MGTWSQATKEDYNHTQRDFKNALREQGLPDSAFNIPSNSEWQIAREVQKSDKPNLGDKRIEQRVWEFTIIMRKLGILSMIILMVLALIFL